MKALIRLRKDLSDQTSLSTYRIITYCEIFQEEEKSQNLQAVLDLFKLCTYITDIVNICLLEFDVEKYFLTKWQGF